MMDLEGPPYSTTQGPVAQRLHKALERSHPVSFLKKGPFVLHGEVESPGSVRDGYYYLILEIYGRNANGVNRSE